MLRDLAGICLCAVECSVDLGKEGKNGFSCLLRYRGRFAHRGRQTAIPGKGYGMAIVALLKDLWAGRLQGSVWQLTAHSYQDVTDAITTVLRKHDRIVVTRLHDKAWIYNPLENC